MNLDKLTQKIETKRGKPLLYTCPKCKQEIANEEKIRAFHDAEDCRRPTTGGSTAGMAMNREYPVGKDHIAQGKRHLRLDELDEERQS